MADGGPGNKKVEIREVRLVCIMCRKERTIHIPRERGRTGIRFWECFECQKTAGDSRERSQRRRMR
ncbi:MAG: hypothetical protein Kow00128_17820 [Deltaproteobacteria bacterium]